MQTPVTKEAAALDLGWVRSQFPSLKMMVDGQPAAFFDGPGGTQVPQRVVDAISDYLLHSNANDEGAFATSARTDATIFAAHEAMADFLGCEADEVVFGANMTTLTMAVSRALSRHWQAGDEVVVTQLEHDANVTPWRALEERGIVIRVVDFDPADCTLKMQEFEEKIAPRTKLVAVGYASNAVGTINPVAEVVRRAHAAGALAYVDAVHYAPHGPIDVRALDCDFLACSTYKFFGPHQGVVYGKREHLEKIKPYKLRACTYPMASRRWETGTQNHECQAGVIACVSYLEDLGRSVEPSAGTRRAALLAAYDAIRRHERALSEALVRGVATIPGARLYGISDLGRLEQRTPTIGIRIEGWTPRQLAEKLGERGIFTWDGNYYAVHVTERLGVEENGGLLRIGAVHYNTLEEVEQVMEELRRIARR